MILYFVLAGAVMTKLRAPFAWYASTQAKLEGTHTAAIYLICSLLLLFGC
jgi:hypothetical protein